MSSAGCGGVHKRTTAARLHCRCGQAGAQTTAGRAPAASASGTPLARRRAFRRNLNGTTRWPRRPKTRRRRPLTPAQRTAKGTLAPASAGACKPGASKTSSSSIPIPADSAAISGRRNGGRGSQGSDCMTARDAASTATVARCCRCTGAPARGARLAQGRKAGLRRDGVPCISTHCGTRHTTHPTSPDPRPPRPATLPSPSASMESKTAEGSRSMMCARRSSAVSHHFVVSQLDSGFRKRSRKSMYDTCGAGAPVKAANTRLDRSQTGWPQIAPRSVPDRSQVDPSTRDRH